MTHHLASFPPPSRVTARVAVALLAACALVGVAAATAQAGPGRAAPLGRSAQGSTVTVTRDLRYGTAPNADGTSEDLLLDLYLPSGNQAADRPAVLFAHGGGFGGGNKQDDQAAELALRFAELGYVAASIDYRLLDGGGCTGAGGVTAECTSAAANAIADGQTAVRWLRANALTYGVDGDRIAFGGISAGAIIATGVGLLSEQPASGSTSGPRSDVAAFASISGGLPGGVGASAADAPGILFSGTADDIVPYTWSQDTAAAMAAAGVTAELVTLEGAGHVPWGEYGAEITQQTVDFFALHLGTATPPAGPSAPREPTDGTAPEARPAEAVAGTPTFTG